ncbi:MAG: two-component regulator propeller domain-containing protein [Chthoniobacter sp.]|nr:two-component regulator propeller domain-containing protein [Chthoniobacter sp.]
MRPLIFACCFLCALGAAIVARAGPDAVPVSEDYDLRTWDTDDGLPENTVTGIAQTTDGYLWLATEGGLARFDGVRFTSFQKGTTPGLESSYARSLAVDQQGALWIGQERGGVARLRDGRFETIVPVAPPSGQTSWVGSFAEDAAGAMWIGLAPDQAVYRWRDGQLTKLTADDGVGAGKDTFVHADADGRIWYATKAMCGIFDGTRFQPFDPEGGVRVHLATARQGGMWATRGNKLLHYWADGRREEIADLEWLGGAVEVTVVYEDHAGDLWLGTRGAGLLRFRAGKFVRVPTSHQGVQAIFEDRDKNLWVGTLSGLNRLRPQRFFLLDSRRGLEKEGVLSLCEDTEGKLWLAVRDSAPVRAIDTRNQFFAAPEGWVSSVTMCICADPQGGVWIGRDGGKLMRWRDGAYSMANTGYPVSTLLCDHEGNLWIATILAGLLRYHDGVVERMPTGDGRVLFRALAEDGTGHIWAGTDDGRVFRQENGQFEPVPIPGAKGGESIRFLVPDGPETVWIGAREGGVSRWRSGRVDRLPIDAGPSMQDLRALVIEPDGGFWLAMGRGLFRTTRKDLEEVLAGTRRLLRGAAYGRDNGLAKLRFAFGRSNAAIRTRDGNLWFATDRGPLEVKPVPASDSPPMSSVLVEEMRVGGELIALASGRSITLPPKPGPIEIRYTAPQLSAPERLQFRYRLVGLEDEWTAGQKDRTATYTRVPPGRYRFEVAASEGPGSEHAVVATFPFVVQAAWWETNLFQGIVGFLSALALAAMVRMIVLRRVRARIRRLEQEHVLEKERARIARDMHDELGASLTRIALMSEIAADEPEMHGAAAQQLGEIAQAARLVTGTLDQIVWTVNPRNDTLERLVGYLGEFSAEYLAPTGLSLYLELPAEVPARIVASETRHEVLLATKEALNNAVKYARARGVTLRVLIGGETLAVVVSDNGCGFDPQAVTEFSNGLINLRQRLSALGGSAEVVSQPGAGTTVTLYVPLAAK